MLSKGGAEKSLLLRTPSTHADEPLLVEHEGQYRTRIFAKGYIPRRLAKIARSVSPLFVLWVRYHKMEIMTENLRFQGI